MGPRVSRARGWKMCELGRDEYFNDFLAAACSATPHGARTGRDSDVRLCQCVDYGDVPCHCFAQSCSPEPLSVGEANPLTRFSPHRHHRRLVIDVFAFHPHTSSSWKIPITTKLHPIMKPAPAGFSNLYSRIFSFILQ